jgi:hypothetical protein
MYLSGKRLHSAFAGYLAAWLYTACIYTSVVAGLFILPDSPQMLCWLMALYLLIKIAEHPLPTTKNLDNMLWFGVVAGIGMLCKVHSIFLWVGLGLYVLLYNRAWLQHWQLYAAAIISLLFFTPVIAWNIQHDFITYSFHSKRVDITHADGVHLDSLFTFIGGQIAYCNPIVFGMIGYALWQRHYGIKKLQKKILLLAAIPLILVANVLALFNDLLPHWTGPALPSLMLLTSTFFASKMASFKKRQMPLALKLAAGLLGFVLLAGTLLVNFLPGTLGSQKPANLGEDDFTLDMYGWPALRKQFDSIRQNNMKLYPKTTDVLIARKWFPASHIDYYIGQPLGMSTYAIGEPDQIHQYYWLNTHRGLPVDSFGIYLIAPSNYPVSVSHFNTLKHILPTCTDSIAQYRGGKSARNVWVYYFKKGKYKLQ